jgi:Spy/CpxP family protein refolding chaperone
MTSSVRSLALVAALASMAIPATVCAQQVSPAPAAPASAAPAAAECGGGGHGANPMAGIQLTPAQRQQIRSFREAFRAQYPCGSKVPKTAREQLQQQIMSVLTPAQQAQYQANLAAAHPQ